MRICRRKARDDRGAAAVEFALILIPFIVLIFGMIDFGAAFVDQIQLSQAAQAGARLAALDFPGADAVARAESGARTLIPASATVTVDYPIYNGGADCSTATTVSVTAHFVYDFLVPLPIPGLNQTPTLSQTAVMTCPN